MRYVIDSGDGTVTVTDTRTLPEAQAEAIARIKAEAGARILAAYPIHAQNNALARGLELANIRHLRQWTPAEADDAGKLETMWRAIKAIRDASNAAEAEVMAATTREDVDAVEVAWPK